MRPDIQRLNMDKGKPPRDDLKEYGIVANPGKSKTKLHDIERRQVRLDAAVLEPAEEYIKYQAMLVDNVSDAIISTGPESHIVSWNRAAENIYGWKQEEVLGKKIADVLHMEFPQSSIREVLEQLDKTGFWRGISVHKRRDGVSLEVAGSVSRIKDASGKTLANVAIYRDISELRSAEARLRESLQFSDSLLQNTPIPTIVINADLSIRYVNPALEKLTGFTSDELVGIKHPYPFWPADMVSAYTHQLLKNTRSTVYRAEKAMVKKTGERFWIELTWAPVFDKDEFKYYMASWVDITERKKVELELRASNKRFTDIAESAFEWIWEINSEGKYSYVSPAVKEILGYEPEEITGKYFYQLFHPDDVEELRKASVKIFLRKQPFHRFIHRNLSKNGNTVWLSKNGVPVLDEEGNVQGYRGTDIDITEPKQAGERIKLKLDLQRVISDISSRFVGISNIDDAINDSLAEIGILSHADRTYLFLFRENGTIMDNTHEWCAEGVSPQKDALQDLPCAMFPWWMERLQRREIIHTPDVSKMPGEAGAEKEILEMQNVMSVLALPVFIQESLYGFIGFDNVLSVGKWDNEDLSLLLIISEIIGNALGRKQYDEALRQSEKRYRELADSLPEIVFEVDIAGNITYANNSGLEYTGYNRDDIDRGLNILQVVIFPDIQESVQEYFQKLLTREYPGNSEYTLLRKDGSTFPIFARFEPVMEDKNNIVGLRGIAIDITERKQLEEQIINAAEEWRTTFDSITESVSIIDKGLKLIRVNKSLASYFGKHPDELVGKYCHEVVWGKKEPCTNCYIRKVMETRSPVKEEIFMPSKGVYLDLTASPIFDENGEVALCVRVTRDITQRKQMQEQLMLTERLVSVGELASGVAHELNNPLTSIIGFSQLLAEREMEDEVKEDLSLICSEAQRCANIVRNLLTFARKHAPQKTLCNINNIIEDVLKLRNHEQKLKNIEVVRNLNASLPEIKVDYFQLQQVFLNIIINAEYFMSQAHNQGILTITTEKRAGKVRISFTDDGPGIEENVLASIFDPFVTTKEVGKGTGLGLSICHGIITEHNGRIDAVSRKGQGATLIIELPVDDLPGGKVES